MLLTDSEAAAADDDDEEVTLPVPLLTFWCRNYFFNFSTSCI